MPATTPSTRNAVPANAERNASSFIRPWKVQAVRAAIAADTYLTEERLRGAVERLLPVLFEDEFIGV